MDVKVDYRAKIKATIPIELNIELSTNDIFNWISNCDDIKTLQYLGRYALEEARRLIDLDDYDDFRSRA